MANLINLEDYKISENIQNAKDDARLLIIIESVSQLVKTYCNNSFVDYFTTAKIEKFNISYNESFVQLTESPVVTTEGNKPVVYERKDTTSSYVTLTEDTDYYVDEDLDCIYRLNTKFPKGPGSVKVHYKAGYSVVPADLKLAVIDLITYYHKDEHKARQTMAGASIQNQTSSSQRDNVAFPDHIKRVLDLYKNF